MTAPRKRVKRANLPGRESATPPTTLPPVRGVGERGRKAVKRAHRPPQGEERAPRPTRSRADGPQLRSVRIGEGLASVPELWQEVQNMTDHLLGRTTSPERFGVLSLAEVADAYFARASEITMLIQAGERTGAVMKGSGHYRFRTGELRTFMEMAKRATDLGSRRLTQEQLNFEQARTGRSAV